LNNKVKFSRFADSSTNISAISTIEESILNRSVNSRMKEAATIPGIPCIHACIHIHYSVDYLILLHHYDYDVIIIHFNYNLIIAIVTAVAVEIVVTPLSLTIYFRYRETRGAYAFGAIVIFKMIRHAVQINKRAYIRYIYIYNCDRCLRYDENDYNDDSECD